MTDGEPLGVGVVETVRLIVAVVVDVRETAADDVTELEITPVLVLVEVIEPVRVGRTEEDTDAD